MDDSNYMKTDMIKTTDETDLGNISVLEYDIQI